MASGTEPRELVHKESIAATVREVVPTARSSVELGLWCTELADKIETYTNLAPRETDALEQGLADERIADLERQLAELQRVSTESAAHWQAQVSNLEMKLTTCEGLVVPLLAVEMRTIGRLREATVVDLNTPTTAELIGILDTMPPLMIRG